MDLTWDMDYGHPRGYWFKGVGHSMSGYFGCWLTHFQGLCDRPPTKESHFPSPNLGKLLKGSNYRIAGWLNIAHHKHNLKPNFICLQGLQEEAFY
jgi:hypothetical protein